MNKQIIAILILCCLLFSVRHVDAAEAGARAYANLPVDLNVLQIRYYQSETIGGFLPYGQATLSVPPRAIDKKLTGMADPTLILGYGFLWCSSLKPESI